MTSQYDRVVEGLASADALTRGSTGNQLELHSDLFTPEQIRAVADLLVTLVAQEHDRFARQGLLSALADLSTAELLPDASRARLRSVQLRDLQRSERISLAYALDADAEPDEPWERPNPWPPAEPGSAGSRITDR